MYFLFGGDNTYDRYGGIYDCRGVFSTLDEAQAAFSETMDGRDNWEWGHVAFIDNLGFRVVSVYNPPPSDLHRSFFDIPPTSGHWCQPMGEGLKVGELVPA